MDDQHLEFDNVILPEFSAVAPILILAEDIVRPEMPSLKPFLLAQCERFKHIFYVAGNHCFYAGEYETHLQQLQALDNLNLRMYFLHNKSCFLPNNVRILGTTLWSHVPWESASRISRSPNDYYAISMMKEETSGDSKRKTRRRLTIDDTNEWHA
ncbi:unnamed protein product [Rotaria magnacalcarata]|uniref:Calcineurin-like phosphoesterase domain-containing protein n=1 Tax=Rotaria magnacalcarata TaxID=392030 RepID=A0A816N5B2_9BILA|nr:unnamed protein product [Rotaria magnacalcarata]CAF4676022.1 unnamed protein product [Rotaria magnacalcarata]CAF5180373.1 unnamed protein product [Rotaria magnacalcarata]